MRRWFQKNVCIKFERKHMMEIKRKTEKQRLACNKQFCEMAGEAKTQAAVFQMAASDSPNCGAVKALSAAKQPKR